MSKEYYIYIDASADVDPAFVEREGIRFVPMNYTVGEEERLCLNLESEELLKKFYDAQREGKETKTSQITPNTYVETFEPVLKEGKSVLYLSLSSGLTKTYDSVCLAARQLAEDYEEEKVLPVDTLGATGSMGLLLELAIENQKQGMSLEENAGIIEKLSHKTELWFMVDDLMYLKRGGRIPASTAVLGTALKIKPIMRVDAEGKLETVEKKRGLKVALKALAEKYREIKNPELGDRVYIVHGDAKDKADQLEKLVLEENPQADITKMMLCPVIGAHTGPGMVALIFFGKGKE